MWIKTQDKKKLINVDLTSEIICRVKNEYDKNNRLKVGERANEGEFNVEAAVIGLNVLAELGTYKDKDSAERVLKSIYFCMTHFDKNGVPYSGFNMPQYEEVR